MEKIKFDKMSASFRDKAVANGQDFDQENSSNLGFNEKKEGFVERFVKIVEAPYLLKSY